MPAARRANSVIASADPTGWKGWTTEEEASAAPARRSNVAAIPRPTIGGSAIGLQNDASAVIENRNVGRSWHRRQQAKDGATITRRAV
jgi:hypothetical protein